MKKRVLSLILALILILSFSACGGKSGKTEKVTVTFPEVSAEREAAERAGAFAVDQYVYARMKTEALIEYDLENGSTEELAAMIDETLEAWRTAEAAANGAEQIADLSESLSASPLAATMYYEYSDESFHPFIMTAYAAEENAATSWAKEITEKFDSYPANARIKTLAQELGVDAKNAYKQLQMAQDILKGDAEREEGDLNALVENTLIATRTVCKTTLYVTGTVASGGASTVLEAGCMIIGGVDTVVDIASTGCTIIRGENDSVTLTLSEVKDYLAPVSAIAGGIGFFSSGIGNLEKFSDQMGLLDKFTYVGDSLLDYFQEDKVLGIQIGGKSNDTSMTITEIDAKDQSAEALMKELKKEGLPIPEASEAKTATEIVSKMEAEMNEPWTMESVQDYLNELMTVLKQQPQSEATNEGEETTPPQSELDAPEANENPAVSGKSGDMPGTIPTMEEIPGTYNMIGDSDAGLKDLTITIDFVLQNGELYAIVDEDDQSVISYDSSTGKAVVPGSNNGSFFAFRKQDGTMHVYYEVDWGNGVWWHLHGTK